MMLGYLVLLLVILRTSAIIDNGEEKYIWCDGEPADIFFLVDSSTSIWMKHFKMQREFLKEIVQHFPLGPTAMRVGLAVFSHHFHTVINFPQYNSTHDLQDAIGRVPHIYGSTFTGRALKKLRTSVFVHARKNVTKIAVVMTDGVSRNRMETAKQADLLKKSGVFVFAIGIGSKVRLSELQTIGSTPSEQFVFSVASFEVLKEIQDALAYKACRVTPEKVLPYCAARRPTDVMFGFESAAMGEYRSAHVRKLIANITGYFGNMDDGTLQAGLLQGLCDEKDIKLNEFRAKEEFVSDLHNATGRGTRDILKDVKDLGYTQENGGRENARKMAVLFIDESTPDLDHTIDEIVQARAEGIEIFVVAIGDDLDLDNLADVLDQPVDQHLLSVSAHKDLDDLHTAYSEMLCEVIEEEPTPPPPPE